MCGILTDVLIVGGIIGCAQFADDAIAVEEHVVGRRAACIPAVAHADSGQRCASREHLVHEAHFLRVERCEVEVLQRRAFIEHHPHLRHLGCVEVAQVEAGQALAAIEHLAHIVDLAGVQVLQVRDGGELCHIGEPAEGASGTGRGKRWVEHHRRNTAGIGLPVGRGAILVRRVSALGVQQASAVGIEGECLTIVREDDVGVAPVGQIAWTAVAAVDASVLFVYMAVAVGGATATDDACAKREHQVAGSHGVCCP